MTHIGHLRLTLATTVCFHGDTDPISAEKLTGYGVLTQTLTILYAAGMRAHTGPSIVLLHRHVTGRITMTSLQLMLLQLM